LADETRVCRVLQSFYIPFSPSPDREGRGKDLLQTQSNLEALGAPERNNGKSCNGEHDTLFDLITCKHR
jgi:hypothetical protein